MPNHILIRCMHSCPYHLVPSTNAYWYWYMILYCYLIPITNMYGYLGIKSLSHTKPNRILANSYLVSYLVPITNRCECLVYSVGLMTK